MHIPQSLSHRSIIVHQIGQSLQERDQVGLEKGNLFFLGSKTNLFLFRHMSLEVLPMLKESKEEDGNDGVLHHH